MGIGPSTKETTCFPYSFTPSLIFCNDSIIRTEASYVSFYSSSHRLSTAWNAIFRPGIRLASQEPACFPYR